MLVLIPRYAFTFANRCGGTCRNGSIVGTSAIMMSLMRWAMVLLWHICPLCHWNYLLATEQEGVRDLKTYLLVRDELKAQYFLLSIRKVRLEARMGGRYVNLEYERKKGGGGREVDNRRSRRARY